MKTMLLILFLLFLTAISIIIFNFSKSEDLRSDLTSNKEGSIQIDLMTKSTIKSEDRIKDKKISLTKVASYDNENKNSQTKNPLNIENEIYTRANTRNSILSNEALDILIHSLKNNIKSNPNLIDDVAKEISQRVHQELDFNIIRKEISNIISKNHNHMIQTSVLLDCLTIKHLDNMDRCVLQYYNEYMQDLLNINEISPPELNKITASYMGKSLRSCKTVKFSKISNYFDYSWCIGKN